MILGDPMKNALRLAIFGTFYHAKWPRTVYYLLRYLPSVYIEFSKDCARYLRYSATFGLRSQKNLRARITETFHNIEKGLSLPNPRPGFGGNAVDTLLVLCYEYIDRYGVGERVIFSAHDVLMEYRDFHKALPYDQYPHMARIDAFIDKIGDECNRQNRFGGLRSMTKADVAKAIAGVSTEFFLQRHSVRQFSKEDVDLSLIDEAVRIALKAPAVCNRQYSRAVVIANPDLVQEVLRMQGGARGFAEGVNKVIVVTTSLSHFWGAAERNQAWIDGGLFAMSLLLGLHAQGLGACSLNWSKLNAQTQRMRDFLHLEGDEVIIMMVAVGHLLDQFDVAFSHRVDISNSVRVLTEQPGEH